MDTTKSLSIVVLIVIVGSLLVCVPSVTTIACHICSSRVSPKYCQPGFLQQCQYYHDCCVTVRAHGYIERNNPSSLYVHSYVRGCNRKSYCNTTSSLCYGLKNCEITCCYKNGCNSGI